MNPVNGNTVRIKEVGRVTTYVTISGKTKEELFDEIYKFFKSHQYCTSVDRFIEDEAIKQEYYKWVNDNSEKLWHKHATGRDFD